MVNIELFVNGIKTKIIAPAGYGKTHFIADCIKYAHDNNLGKQLVLTHTHAGVASIKAKLLKHNVPHSAYNIETICGYAQKYVLGFATYPVPEQKTDTFYTFIIEKATELFLKTSITEIIKKTYTGIFIDEYQDCTSDQHNMLMQFKDVIPLHLLGDPMQGIFNFNGQLVDFDRDLTEFSDNAGSLQRPWRWEVDENNQALGLSLKQIRDHIENNNSINLSQYGQSISIINVCNDIYQDANYRNQVLRLSRLPKTLIITQGRINQRKQLRNTLPLPNFQLVEAIDDKDFYNLAARLDNLCSTNNQFMLFIEICKTFLFNRTDIQLWFNNTGLKRKTNATDKEKSEQIRECVDKLIVNSVDIQSLHHIIKFMRDGLRLKYQRPELLQSIIKALKDASVSNVSVSDAMYNHKNQMRQMGRNLHNRCIGTTLLTKGLEFDNVVVLDAQGLDKKNFYVAITRACKNLTIFTNTNNLNF